MRATRTTASTASPFNTTVIRDLAARRWPVVPCASSHRRAGAETSMEVPAYPPSPLDPHTHSIRLAPFPLILASPRQAAIPNRPYNPLAELCFRDRVSGPGYGIYRGSGRYAPPTQVRWSRKPPFSECPLQQAPSITISRLYKTRPPQSQRVSRLCLVDSLLNSTEREATRGPGIAHNPASPTLARN